MRRARRTVVPDTGGLGMAGRLSLVKGIAYGYAQSLCNA